MEGKRAKCTRMSCGIVLFLLTTIVLLGAVCAFISNQLIKTQVVQNGGTLDTVVSSLTSVEMYKDHSIDDLKKMVLGGFQETKVEVFSKLDRTANNTKEILGNVTGSGPLLDVLTTFTGQLTSINANFRQINTSAVTLQGLGETLGTELQDFKTDADNKLTNIPGTDEIRAKLKDLNIEADFSRVSDISKEIDTISSVIGDDIVGKINEGKATFDKIASDIQVDISSNINKAKNQTEVVQKEVDKYVNDIVKTADSLNFTSWKSSINKVKPIVKDSGEYFWYAGIGLSSVLLLVVLCNYLGFLFGVCGERPGRNASACNRGVGANCLLAGVGFMFLFGWLLMIVTMVIFLAGGVTHAELCRHFVQPETSKAIKAVDDMLQNTRSVNFNGSIQDIFINCKANQALYTAFNVERLLKINISEITDIKKYGIDKILDDLKNINFKIENVTLLTPEARNLINQLKDGTKDLNFTSFLDELDKNITQIDLRPIVDDLRTFGQAPTDELAKTLETIANTTVGSIEEERATLSKALHNVSGMALGDSLDKVLQAVNTSETLINTNGTQAVKAIINTLATDIYQDINTLLKDIDKGVRMDIGRCLPLYDAVESSVHSACVKVLYPLNTFWLGHGVALICFIPLIFIAIVLAGQYRRTTKYQPEYLQDPDPQYDSTMGREKHPMYMDMHRIGPEQRELMGQNNPVYVTETELNMPRARRPPSYHYDDPLPHEIPTYQTRGVMLSKHR